MFKRLLALKPAVGFGSALIAWYVKLVSATSKRRWPSSSAIRSRFHLAVESRQSKRGALLYKRLSPTRPRTLMLWPEPAIP